MSLKNLEIQSYILYKPDFLGRDNNYFFVTLERRGQTNGKDKWGIFKNGYALFKDEKDFGYEGTPSNRTQEQLDNTRFLSPEEALNFWKSIEKEYEKNLKDMHASIISKKNNK